MNICHFWISISYVITELWIRNMLQIVVKHNSTFFEMTSEFLIFYFCWLYLLIVIHCPLGANIVHSKLFTFQVSSLSTSEHNCFYEIILHFNQYNCTSGICCNIIALCSCFLYSCYNNIIKMGWFQVSWREVKSLVFFKWVYNLDRPY